MRGRAITLLVLFSVLLLGSSVQAQEGSLRPGEVYELRRSSRSESRTDGGGSSGSSNSGAVLIERVIALHGAGVELEYDLPDQATKLDRDREWQLPARVLKTPGHPLQLLNRPALEARLKTWLEWGGMTEAACGRWLFTWTAIKIECDPQAVLSTIEAYTLPESLQDGAEHLEPGALASARLRRTPDGARNASFSAEFPLDPQVIRRERAEADVVVAEIMGKGPLTLEAALRDKSTERIEGTITVTFETDRSGQPVRRTRITRYTVTPKGERTERFTITETLERRRLR